MVIGELGELCVIDDHRKATSQASGSLVWAAMIRIGTKSGASHPKCAQARYELKSLRESARTLSKAYSCATSVFVDELDPGIFQRLTDRALIRSGEGCGPFHHFSSANRICS
jgi:hypothetical protein